MHSQRKDTERERENKINREESDRWTDKERERSKDTING